MTFDDWWSTLKTPPIREYFIDTLGELDEFATHGATEHRSFSPSTDLSGGLGVDKMRRVLYGNFNEQLSSYIERLHKQGAKFVPVDLVDEENGSLTIFFYIKSF